MRFKEIHEGLRELQLMNRIFMTHELPELPYVMVFRSVVQPDSSISLKPFFTTNAAASAPSENWTHRLIALDKDNKSLIELNVTLPPPGGSTIPKGLILADQSPSLTSYSAASISTTCWRVSGAIVVPLRKSAAAAGPVTCS